MSVKLPWYEKLAGLCGVRLHLFPFAITIKVANETGGTLAKNTTVSFSGWSTTYGAVKVVKADADDPALLCDAVLGEAIANNATGQAVLIGVLSNIDTSAIAAVGNPLYLSGTAGALSTAALTGADQVSQIVGRVKVKSATIGETFYYPLLKKILKVGTSYLQPLSVGTAALADDSVTAAKTDTAVPGVVEASKIVVADANKDVTGFRDLTVENDLVATDDVVAGVNGAAGSAGRVLVKDGANPGVDGVQLIGNNGQGIFGNTGIDGLVTVKDAANATAAQLNGFTGQLTSKGLVSGDANGTAAANVTAVEYGDSMGVHKSVLTVDFTAANALAITEGAGAAGWATGQLYTFPAGMIRVLGVCTDLALTGATAAFADAGSGDFGIGGAATADITLDAGEVDIMASTAMTDPFVAKVGDANGAVANATVGGIDGTTSGGAGPAEAHLNCIFDAGDITAPGATVAVAGTVTLTWVNLGDF
ncbi:MAG: hypothetical protein ACYDCO_01770 [Armatimonadota bacterium]